MSGTTPRAQKKSKSGKPRELRITERERLFVAEFCSSLNKTQAAINAGYAEGSASIRANELVGKSYIQQLIEDEFRSREERLRLTGDYVALQVHESFLRSVAKGKEGAALKALDMLARMVGAYERDNAQRATHSLTREQIEARLREAGINPDMLVTRRVTVETPVIEDKSNDAMSQVSADHLAGNDDMPMPDAGDTRVENFPLTS